MSEEKQVDESWKETASQEKEILQQPKDQDQDVEGFEVNFINYVTSLGFQAMIFLGEIPNPMTNKQEKNLEQAKFLIDTLSMLKEKTEGNLSEQEANLLSASVYELQLKFVEVTKSGIIGGAAQPGESA